MGFLVVAVIILILWFIIKPYVIHYDTVLLFTGGLGSGKSLVSSKMAMKLLKKNRFSVWWYNLKPWHRDKRPKPMLYSSIPFRISKKEWALQLTAEHMTLRANIIPRSVLFVDEIALFLDQMTVKFPASENVEEFATLFRHYTQGGYLVMNTQNSNKVNFHFRYCVNECLNLMHFKKWLPFFPIFYTVKVRNISLADDIKTVEEGNKEENMSTLFGFLPIPLLSIKNYDTYCYSERYRTVPKHKEKRFCRLKSSKLMKCPSGKVPNFVTDNDPAGLNSTVYFDNSSDKQPKKKKRDKKVKNAVKIVETEKPLLISDEVLDINLPPIE